MVGARRRGGVLVALRLRFFAQCADWAGRREMEVSVGHPRALTAVLRELPALAPLLAHQDNLKVAVNCEYAPFDAEVQDGDEVAFMPPFSGG